jgi:hypothetical protein
MKLLQKLLILKTIFLLLSAQSYASSWKTKVFDSTSEFDFPFDNGHMATLQGSCHKPKYKKRELPGKRVTYKISISEFSKKEIKIQGVLQRDEKKNFIKAPVAFYIPGAFSNIDISQTRRFMHDLGNMGYHVLVFPNPWGTDFIKTRVNKPIGDVHFEGQAMFSLIKRAYGILNEMDITTDKSRLIGVSYGGFVTSVVSALNIEENNPLRLVDSTIISPPLLLPKTLNNLDKLVEDNRETIHLNLISLYSRYLKYCKLENDFHASEKELQQVEGLVIRGGFYDSLIGSVGKYNKIFKLKLIPDFFYGVLSKKYRRWKKSFNFQSYFDEFAPKNLDVLKSQYGSLYYWKNRAASAGYDNFRVLLAQNDFLNNPEDIISTPDTMVLHTGGHYGFRHLKWFDKFLEISFKDSVLNK